MKRRTAAENRGLASNQADSHNEKKTKWNGLVGCCPGRSGDAGDARPSVAKGFLAYLSNPTSQRR